VRFTARFLHRRLLRAQGVPTNPLMPKSEQFGVFGKHKQLCKVFTSTEYLPSTRLSDLHALTNGIALCLLTCAGSSSHRMQGEGHGIRISMAGLKVVPTALSLPHLDPCNHPPTAQAFDELMSETSLYTPEATPVACVLSRLNGLRGCCANLQPFQTPSKVFTF